MTWRCPACKRAYRSEAWVTRHTGTCGGYARWWDATVLPRLRRDVRLAILASRWAWDARHFEWARSPEAKRNIRERAFT